MKTTGEPVGKKKNINILIAEDSPTQAMELEALLRGHGYGVVVAADGKQALAAARRHKPALIISDVLMPELDGYGLCKAIKSDAKLKDTPVVLVTTLSDAQDVIRGLECGADNFIRKPYDERYLLSRIEYLLMNLELRRNQKMQLGLEINLGGHKHFITAERQQILDLLVSTYEQAVHINNELKLREKDLAHSNQVLQGLYRIAEGLNRVVSEREVAETALERALDLPGIQAGWISLREGESGFRLAAARGLPPALSGPDALNGSCACRRKLLSGELDHVTNILECERLAKAKGDSQGLRLHASVPLWLGDGHNTLGVMNLAGPGDKLFDEEELKVLYNVGNQVAVALERARLHEHLEKLVDERTAALRASEAHLRTIIEAEPECVKIVDEDGRVVHMNAAGLAMIEADSLGQVQGGKIAEFVVSLQREAYRSFEASVLDGKSAVFEFEIIGLKGVHRWLDTHAVPLPEPRDGRPQMLAITRDITERKAQEVRIMRLNRLLAVLSGINTTIVRVHDRQELFEQACHIAVDDGQFVFAWLGMLDAGTQMITPLARAGRDDGYLAGINLTVIEDAPGGCRLIAHALTQARPVICNDIATDERMEQLRGPALQRGYRSAVVLPLILDGRPVGAFVLYASETGVFDDEEMRLLVEMAGDISFALDHLKKEEQLNYLAYFDGITGLPNRVLFQDRLERAMVDAGRRGRLVGVVFLDMDRFKTINDSLGHAIGDQFLKGVAERLMRAAREGDTVARLAGDEFGLVLADMRHADDAAGVAQKILDSFAQPFSVAGHEIFASASLGLTLYPLDDDSVVGLVRNADVAMYRAKESGGNTCQFYSADMTSKAHERLALENALRHALDRGEFLLHYQPIVDLKSGEVTGVEALVRWRRPERGLVPPDEFIPLAEETGLIVSLGEWVLRTACEQCQACRAAGGSPLHVAVNVSARQFQLPDFPDMVAAIVKRTGFDPAFLDLEITESLLMQNVEATLTAMHKLGAHGIQFSIDDFGTGYSSLAYLKRLPIGNLKIDRSFVRDVPGDANDAAMVTAIISMAHSLDIQVIAEGVETQEQLEFLRAQGCDFAQGYYFSWPLPAGEIGQVLK